MRLALLEALRVILLVSTIAGFLSGCNGTNPDTTQRMTITVESAATVLNAVANARDAGLVTQTLVNQYKPIVDAFAAAKAQAEKSLAAGDTNAYTSALNQLNAAYNQLVPLLQQINAKKTAATTAP